MGQVCTKNIDAQVHSESAPSAPLASPTASPLGSRNRSVFAYTGPEVCTRIDITKYKIGNKATPGATNLVCDFYGAAGCFVCDLKNIKKLLLDKKTVLKSPKEKPLNNQAFYDWFQSPTNGVCMKIFFDTDQSRIAYPKERDSYTVLKDLMGDNVSYFTAYAEYQGVNAFTVSFNSRSFDVFMNGNPIPVKRLNCLLFKSCNQSLNIALKDPVQRANISIGKLVEDIGCVLQLLHKDGYCHADIKPENIIVCENEPITYKLIDFALTKYTELKGPSAFTWSFILPTLVQEVIFKNKPNVSWEQKKQGADLKIFEMTQRYNPKHDQEFLIQLSLNAFTENDLTVMHTAKDYSPLFYKTDEYALAMTILEVLGITDEDAFKNADAPVKTIVQKLIAKEPYFKDTPLEQCKAMATRLMTARSATIGSAFASKSARDGGARSGNKRNMNRRRS